MTDERMVNLLLSRSEETCRQVSEILVRLGKIDERLSVVTNSHDRYFDRVREVETRVDKLELAHPLHALTHKWVLIGVSVLAGGTLMFLGERLLGLVR